MQEFFFLCVTRLISAGSNEGDPRSPPKGEATQGEHLLTPTFKEATFRGFVTFWDALAAKAEALRAKPPGAIMEENLICHS